MYIDLTKLSEGRTDFDKTLQIELDDESAGLPEPCRIVGELRKGAAGVDVEGKIEAIVQTECSRCLVPISLTLDIPFNVSYVTEEFYTAEKESELHGDDLAVAIYDGEKIDLTELAREQILLNLPTQPLCGADCRGLCPTCGANLNLADCSCERKEIDPRWENLRQLKIKE
jgi:uncharacterized protein